MLYFLNYITFLQGDPKYVKNLVQRGEFFSALGKKTNVPTFVVVNSFIDANVHN